MAASTSRVRPLVAGNWKMNGLSAALAEGRQVRDRLQEAGFATGVDVMICPPATLVAALARDVAGSRLLVGAQDCHAAPLGAPTGDIGAEMHKDAGATAVIVGHSERRTEHGERDRDVKAKALAAHRARLTAIVCIGETAGERRAGLTLQVVARQLAGSLPESANAENTVLAYEPVWAIGTGLTPTLQDVTDVHGFLRRTLLEHLGSAGDGIRLLYGGSVKPDNARSLMGPPDVNGALAAHADPQPTPLLTPIA